MKSHYSISKSTQRAPPNINVDSHLTFIKVSASVKLDIDRPCSNCIKIGSFLSADHHKMKVSNIETLNKYVVHLSNTCIFRHVLFTPLRTLHIQKKQQCTLLLIPYCGLTAPNLQGMVSALSSCFLLNYKIPPPSSPPYCKWKDSKRRTGRMD